MNINSLRKKVDLPSDYGKKEVNLQGVYKSSQRSEILRGSIVQVNDLLLA